MKHLGCTYHLLIFGHLLDVIFDIKVNMSIQCTDILRNISKTDKTKAELNTLRYVVFDVEPKVKNRKNVYTCSRRGLQINFIIF